MEHKAVFISAEIFPGVPIPQIPTIPSMTCIKANNTRVYITDGPLFVGDTIEPLFVKKRTVLEVIASRPAMGDWSGSSYNGLTPTYNLVRVE